MKVVVPYTDLEPEVQDALVATGWPEVTPVFVGGTDRAYFDLLSSLWRQGETFAIVEHDIVVHPTALHELAECPHEWCGFPHEIGSLGPQYGLGCVKFDAALIARHPDALIRVGVMWDAEHPKRHWCTLDIHLQGVYLPSRCETKHHHERAVRHLGSGCSHGCSRLH